MTLEEELAIVLRGHRAIILVEVNEGDDWSLCSMQYAGKRPRGCRNALSGRRQDGRTYASA